jgi:hypothetical protein
MLTRLTAGIAVVLSVAACASTTPSVPQRATLSAEQIALGTIRLGLTADEVRRVLGPPTSERQEEPVFCNSEVAVEYPSTEAYFCDGRLANLKTVLPELSTPAGLQVGMSLKAAQQIYGPGEKLNWASGEGYAYRDSSEFLALILHVENGTIVSLELWSDFT